VGAPTAPGVAADSRIKHNPGGMRKWLMTVYFS
jgi:hypothetical protein